MYNHKNEETTTQNCNGQIPHDFFFSLIIIILTACVEMGLELIKDFDNSINIKWLKIFSYIKKILSY